MCIKKRGNLTIVISDATPGTPITHTLRLNGDWSWTPPERAETEIIEQDGTLSETDAPVLGEETPGSFAFEAYQREAGDSSTLELTDLMNKTGGLWDTLVSTRDAACDGAKTLTWTGTFVDDAETVTWLMEGVTHNMTLAATLNGNKISGTAKVRKFTPTRA